MRQLLYGCLFSLLLSGSPAGAQSAETVQIGPTLRAEAVALPQDIRDLLKEDKYNEVADALISLEPDHWGPGQKSEYGFVLCWSLYKANRVGEISPYLSLIEQSEAVPIAYQRFLEGVSAWQEGDLVGANDLLSQVPKELAIYPRSVIAKAEVLRELGRTEEGFALYIELADQEPGAEGSAVAMLALANRAGDGSDEARRLARKIWVEHPFSQAAYEVGPKLVGRNERLTVSEVSRRAEDLMYGGSLKDAITFGQPYLLSIDDDGVGELDACRLLYVVGRSQYKLNRRTKAGKTFGGIAERCQREAHDYGAKGQYLKGMVYFRAGAYEKAAETFSLIAQLYPEHSYADDGLTMAASSLLEVKDVGGATMLINTALEETPLGDTLPDGVLKVAVANYVAGDTAVAIELVQAAAKLPLDGDWVGVAGARYWHARWQAYPDAAAPTKLNPAGKDAAVDEWLSLVTDLPWSFYSIQAYNRLVELAPDRAAEVVREELTVDVSSPWLVREVLVDDPAFAVGVDLSRLGLLNQAEVEWARASTMAQTGDEMAWMAELREAGGDWHRGHVKARWWLKGKSPSTLGPARREILKVIYPNQYWVEVKLASEPYSFEPRFFHSLVREESTFDAEVVSWAGAIGLAQLMPPTARQVCGWLGVPYKKSELVKPEVNLMLGAKYLATVLKGVSDSPYLALAGYNAGPHRVRTWSAEFGDVPTDEFVERIPFKETRHYVKRVMGSWQLMIWEFDKGVVAPDLQRYNHHHLPK